MQLSKANKIWLSISMEKVRNHDLDGVTKILQSKLEGKKYQPTKKPLKNKGLIVLPGEEGEISKKIIIY